MIKIYGASDDLIEIEGDINEEFNVYPENDTRYLLAFSTGHLLKMWYDEDGIWRIQNMFGLSVIEQGDVIKDTNDKATILDAVNWVVLGEHSAYRKAT